MNIMRSKRRRGIALSVIAALVVAGGAVAYWTASGTGQGTATVGTTSGVTIGGVALPTTLYPGGSTPVNFTITNLSASTGVTIAQVVADTSFGTNGITNLPGGCDPADFSFANLAGPWTIAASGNVSASGTLSFANTSSNQDACKSATPVLHLKTA